MTEGPAPHTLAIRIFPADDEYRPDCSCGWTGSYLPSETHCRKEWAKHVHEETERGGTS